MKKLLILGGFPQMIDIVLKARDLDIYTIVVDRDESSPAKRFSNEAFNLSTDRIDELETLCLKEQVNGIFTGFEDFNIHIACELCKRLNLPFYGTEEQIELITDKEKIKKTCKDYNVPVINSYSIDEAMSARQYPYIIKPADSYGSRGITVASSPKELIDGYENACRNSRTKRAVIERFIDNDHGVELFYTIVEGSIYLTITADRYTVQNEGSCVPLPVAEVFPSMHKREIKDKLDRPLREMFAGLGIRNGLILVQALYDGSDYFIYEFAYRLSGEQHYRLVKQQHGIDLGEFMIKLALGEDISSFKTALLDEAFFEKPSINQAIILKPGKIRHIQGLEKVYKIDEVISYNLTHFDNDVINPSGDYSQMLIRVNMVADNYENLCKAVNQVNDYIDVISVEGEDMVSFRFSLPEA